jgi:hypothetical protein
MRIAKNWSKDMGKYSKRFWWNFNYKKYKKCKKLSQIGQFQLNYQINMQIIFLNKQILLKF